ncbi:MAG TPA: hypothetical protein VFH27_13595 [Longimicrobiaceae bacterium]|nr:hypothetical protein [Longimicrobiaceae bacterium]
MPLRIPTPRSVLPLLCAAALLAGACRRGSDTIPTERFVRANVALRMVNDSGPKADSQRKAILRRTGVTAAELRHYVAVNGRRHPGTLARAWEAIDDSVQRRLSDAAAARPQGQPVAPPAAPIAGPGAQPPPAVTPAVPAPPINRAKADLLRQGAPRATLPGNSPATAALPPPPSIVKTPPPPATSRPPQ